ncbi:unnamed protein product [Prunus armeniaca]
MWGLVEGFTVDFGGSGLDDVSIKEIGNRPFLVRFCNKKDKLPDMEPWTFRDSLVVLVDSRAGLDTREVEFHHSTYWIQLHGILPLNMTTMVAQKIGSLVGKVLEVDQADGVECMGRFLQRLIKTSQRARWKFCTIFPALRRWRMSGWRLRFGERNVSQGNNSTSSGGRWRHERSSRLGEPRHLQQRAYVSDEKNKSVNDVYKKKPGNICKRRRVGIPQTGYGYLRRMGT